MDKFTFGIGCFHFGINKNEFLEFKTSEYIKELRTFLESIVNIENVKITGDDCSVEKIIKIENDLPKIDEGNGFFPRWSNLKIEMDLYIPFQIQEQLIHNLMSPLMPKYKSNTFTDKFKVTIFYAYFLPVAFIELINPVENGDPSDAVLVVREFLEHKFINSSYIKFEHIGPSPFHANCYIIPNDGYDLRKLDLDFVSKITIAKRGYDEITFYYDLDLFKDSIDAKEHIFLDIKDELSFYYALTHLNVKRMHRWEKIEKLIKELTQNAKGYNHPLKMLEEVAWYSHKINNAFISVAKFESDKVFEDREKKRCYTDIYSDVWVSHFQRYIDESINNEDDYPTKEMIQLLGYLENKRSKKVELFTIIVSAILGGGIGALITRYLSISP